MNSTSFILLVSKGILRDRHVRRTVLFWIVVANLGLLGTGALLLDAWLSEHPVLLLLYWGACLWLTVTSLLLALYDLLAIRREAALERQRLKAQVLGTDEPGDRSL
ncbi:MAG: hypothetical protein NTZ46_04920 [Verrucomicrobia bacterium]|nr:hypothetical protein [Verrucomicrobiota bacterium]